MQVECALKGQRPECSALCAQRVLLSKSKHVLFASDVEKRHSSCPTGWTHCDADASKAMEMTCYSIQAGPDGNKAWFCIGLSCGSACLILPCWLCTMKTKYPA